MREILFRGKRIDNGEWAEGYLYASNISGCFILQTQTRHRRLKTGGMELFDRLITIEVDGTTVGQYTGLTDKNGTKIFEGDIVRDNAVWHEGEIQIKSHVNIVGVDKGCWIMFHDKWWDFLYTNASDAEIIGNIYDNPELIEGEK